MRIYRTRYTIFACVFVLFIVQPFAQAADPLAAKQKVTQWLVDACELGDESELMEKVVPLGKAGVDALIAAHQDGPPLDIRASIEEAAARRYRQRRSVLKDPNLLQIDPKKMEKIRGEEETEFVKRQLDSFIAGYKNQALNGLRQFRDEQATAYLHSLKTQ